ncbi:MAG: ABC transporter permease [Planctomycetota bacterium]
MTQTLALLLDAYRELNAKKMFWITLILSALVMLGIAAAGIHETGFSVLWFKFDLWDMGDMGAESMDEIRAAFYKEIFRYVGVTIWLTWAAIILAIVSTASMFPDLMSSGSIDTLLSKPISRLRLFLTKYLLGLGFVALQVLVFCIAGFFVIGFRAGDWEPRIFLAVPIVLMFFSYLYAISTLVGVYTRSTLAAIVATVIVWFGLFAINAADGEILEAQAENQVMLDRYRLGLEYAQTLDAEPPEEGGRSEREQFLQMWGGDIDGEIDALERSVTTWENWRRRMMWVKTPLPKTGETRSLLRRALVPTEDLELPEYDPADGPDQAGFMGIQTSEQATPIMMMRIQRDQRPAWWIVVTSLLFEFVVVGLAAWKFCRRDF